jgi:tryptophan 2,3-dioxygenase
MSDIVERLRNWRTVHLARLHLLMEEAADEMERLSARGDFPVQDNAAKQDILTDAEREAVERAVAFCECTNAPLPTSDQIATLRALLERTRG